MSGPSVPYAGNPANYPAAVNILGGSDTPATTTLNTTSEGILDRTAWLRANLDSTAVWGWGPVAPVASVISPSTGVTVAPSACYDPVGQQWLIAAEIPLSMNDWGGALTTIDGGRTFSYLGTFDNNTGAHPSVVQADAVATDGAGNVLFILPGATLGGPTLVVPRFCFGPASPYAPAVHSYTGTQATVQTAFWHPGAGLFVEVEATVISTTWNGGAFSATASGSVAPVSLTSSLPASWTGATGSALNGIYATVNTGGSLALVGIGGVAGTSASRLMTITAALSFTDLGSPSPLGSNAQVQGVAWSAFNSLWGILTYDGSNSHLWTTPDLSTWTEVESWPGLAGGVACAGQVWAVSVATALGGNTNRVLYSTSVASGASAAWYASQQASNGLMAPALFSSGTQFCLVDRAGAAVAISDSQV